MAGEIPWPAGELRDLSPDMATQKAIIKLMQILSGDPEATRFECHICGEYREVPSFDPGVLQIKRPVCALAGRRCEKSQTYIPYPEEDYGFVPGSFVWCPDQGGSPLRPAIVEPFLDGVTSHVVPSYRNAPHEDCFYFVTLIESPGDCRRGGFIRGDTLHTMYLKFGNDQKRSHEELYREYETFADQVVNYDLVTRLRLFSYTSQVAFGLTRPLHQTQTAAPRSCSQCRAQRLSDSLKTKRDGVSGGILSLGRRVSLIGDEARLGILASRNQQTRPHSSASSVEGGEAGLPGCSGEDEWSVEAHDGSHYAVGHIGPISPSMISAAARARFYNNSNQVCEAVYFECERCGALRQASSHDPGVLVNQPQLTCSIAAGGPVCQTPATPLSVKRYYYFVPGTLVWYRSPETGLIWPAIVELPPNGVKSYKRPYGVAHEQTEYYITLIAPPGALGGGYVKAKDLKHMSKIRLQSSLLRLAPDMYPAAKRAWNALPLSLADRLKLFSIVALAASLPSYPVSDVGIKRDKVEAIKDEREDEVLEPPRKKHIPDNRNTRV